MLISCPSSFGYPTITIMFSARFQRQIIVTRDAHERMVERNISDEILLEVINSGETHY